MTKLGHATLNPPGPACGALAREARGLLELLFIIGPVATSLRHRMTRHE